jgi:hypothetical protein
MLLILLIVVIILLFTGIPSQPWGYNRQGNYGYWPSGIGLIVLIVLILLLCRVI